MINLELMSNTKESIAYIKGLEPHKEILKNALFSALKEILRIERGRNIEWEFGRLFNDGDTPYYRVRSIELRRENQDYWIDISLEQKFDHYDLELAKESQDLFLFIKETYTKEVLKVVFGEDPLSLKINQMGDVKVTYWP